MNGEPRYNPQQRQPGAANSMSRWWRIFLVFFAAWIVYALFFRQWGPNRIEIDYTVFKSQTEKGNIENVVIQGQSINGSFVTAWSPPEDSSKQGEGYTSFATTRPPFEDSELLPLLEENGVTIKAEPEQDNWWITVLILAVPWLLIMGYFYYMRRKMQGTMGKGGGMMSGGIFGVGKSKAKKYDKEQSDVTYEDVAGLDKTKRELEEIIDYLKEPERFTALGASIPKGILLMGPPGTGKTLLAKATAGEADVPFFSISGSSFIEMFVGVGASRVRDMFENAKKESPSIIFIDEIDSVGRTRGAGLGGGHDEREQTLNQILSEMDGFETHESVVVIAATNRPDILDKALTRPGRFDRQLTLELPQREARTKIFAIHTSDMPVADDVDLENLAARTVGFSGADIKNMANEAALFAGREESKRVKMKHFEAARDKVLLGGEREEMINDAEKKITAWHEAGHALMAMMLPEADPLQKVTIIPRGKSLGVTEQIPENERHQYRKKYLDDRIAVMLGGREAERIAFDDITNGSAMDLKVATKLARKMVCQWGMSEKLGAATFSFGEEHLFLGRELSQQKDFSEETARVIDEEIMRILDENGGRTAEALAQNRTKLDALAEALLEKETMEADEIEWLLDKVDEDKQNGNNGKKEKQER